ncbi:MAG: NAD(P)H-binding protein [Gammaproteobacteria bacterium]|jgi:NAD(P)H dehydrogenase (quinone)|nr:NAD(P)H-binding protein [Gammaproteobacteria bacterium]
MQIAVTAATGRLGEATLRALSGQVAPDQLIAVAREPERVGLPGIAARHGDYASPDSLVAAFAGIDTVVFISAPVAGGSDRMQLHRNVIEAARQAGVRKVIYTSVIGNERAEQTLFAPFQAINRDTEALLQYSGLDWVIARNGLYLDLDILHIRKADTHGGVYRNNGGTGRCGYISIAELGAALAALATSDACNGTVVNLIGDLHTQAELVEFVNAAYGLNVSYEPITLEQNVARFMADERIAARGEAVARMLSGCFECIDRGGFEVNSDFERAVGRPPLSIPEQLATLR